MRCFARQTSQTVENDREILRSECHEIISGRGAFSDKLHVNSSTYARLGSTLTISGERNDRDGFNSIQKGKEKYEDTHSILYISGERKFEKKEEKNRKFLRVERFSGTFERTFTVPEDADATKIMAEFHDGVLQVHLPKHPTVKPQVIEAKVQ